MGQRPAQQALAVEAGGIGYDAGLMGEAAGREGQRGVGDEAQRSIQGANGVRSPMTPI